MAGRTPTGSSTTSGSARRALTGASRCASSSGKKSQHITHLDQNRALPSCRSRGRRWVDLRFRRFGRVGVERCRDFVNASSRVDQGSPQVKNSWVELRVGDVTGCSVNSEGSRVIDQSRIASSVAISGCSHAPAATGSGAHPPRHCPRSTELPSLGARSSEEDPGTDRHAPAAVDGAER